MSIHYERDTAKRLITATSVGTVTLNDALEIIDRQAADGAWSYGVLYDTLGSDNSPTREEVIALVKHVAEMTVKHGPRGPVALITSHSTLQRMGQRYSILGELTALDFRVFENRADAEHWLSEMTSS